MVKVYSKKSKVNKSLRAGIITQELPPQSLFTSLINGHCAKGGAA